MGRYDFIQETILEHNERMQNIKKYYPFFLISDNNLEQFKNGKYRDIDMSYMLLAILRMFIEENNFNDTGVTYRDYSEFVIKLLKEQFNMYLSDEEYREITDYIFDKIKNDGKPFEYRYYDPDTKTYKTARVWFIKSNLADGNIYYYITDTGIEFYLDTKEIKDESKISIQQILLEKMIRTKNFAGGREVVRRICNEVSKLQFRKREVLNIMTYNINDGIEAYEDFFEKSIKWFKEEHELFMRNSMLVENAISMLSPAEEAKNRQDIFMLDTELKVAIERHSKLLEACMDLKIKCDDIIRRGKINALKPSMDFKTIVDTMIDMEDSRKLSLLSSPLFNPKIYKMFDLNRLDDMLSIKATDDDDTETISDDEEQAYIYDDELEEERISHNCILFIRVWLDMILTNDSFTLREYNDALKERFDDRVFINGDYYTFLVHMSQKNRYDMAASLKKKETYFEKIIEAFYDAEKEYTKDIDVELYKLPDDEIKVVEGFTVTNIRFERRYHE